MQLRSTKCTDTITHTDGETMVHGPHNGATVLTEPHNAHLPIQLVENQIIGTPAQLKLHHQLKAKVSHGMLILKDQLLAQQLDVSMNMANQPCHLSLKDQLLAQQLDVSTKMANQPCHLSLKDQ